VTIAEAAAEVLRSSKKPLSLAEIVAGITDGNLYAFNSTDKLSIVREQVRRHCYLPHKTLQYQPTLFVQLTEDIYDLMERNPQPRSASYRRVRRARDKDPLIEKLTKKGDARFGEIWRLLIFAACLGVARNAKQPLGDYDTGKSIDFSYFGGCHSWPGFLYLLNLVELGDATILNPDQDTVERQILCFEEYANGGLSIMQSELEARDYSLDAIVGLIPTTLTPATQQGDSSAQI
jgi:dnd system-associated protein 4